ncbi:MAG: hypothetical protein P4L83_02095 [Nevskia sp.]|nr:hypothetical protein [Nevskia sp.]
MRIVLMIAGVLIAGLGVATAMGKFQYSENKEVLRLGEFSAKVQQEQTVPQWVGITAIAVGGLLVVGGALWRKR